MEVTEDARSSGLYGLPYVNGYCGGVVMVDRLLEREGTSSTDIRSGGPGSQNESERVSVVDDVAVPRRGVLSEAWLLLR